MGCTNSGNVVSRTPIYQIKDIELKKVFNLEELRNISEGRF